MNQDNRFNFLHRTWITMIAMQRYRRLGIFLIVALIYSGLYYFAGTGGRSLEQLLVAPNPLEALHFVSLALLMACIYLAAGCHRSAAWVKMLLIIPTIAAFILLEILLSGNGNFIFDLAGSSFSEFTGLRTGTTMMTITCYPVYFLIAGYCTFMAWILRRQKARPAGNSDPKDVALKFRDLSGISFQTGTDSRARPGAAPGGAGSESGSTGPDAAEQSGPDQDGPDPAHGATAELDLALASLRQSSVHGEFQSTAREDFRDQDRLQTAGRKDKSAPAVLRLISYAAFRGIQSQELREICRDDLAERFGLTTDPAAFAGEMARAQGMTEDEFIQGIDELSRQIPDELFRKQAYCALAEALFYDEEITAAEHLLLSRMGQAFGLKLATAARILDSLGRAANLRFSLASHAWIPYGAPEQPTGGSWSGYGSAGTRSGSGSGSGKWQQGAWGDSGTNAGTGANAGRKTGTGEQSRKQDSQTRKKGQYVPYDDLRSAYTTLQQHPTATDEELRKAYIRMVARYHPDRAAALGLSEEEKNRYKETTQRLNGAWELISKARGL